MDHSKTLPRDVFLYLLSVITLVTVSISLGVLLYQYVNLLNPDALSEGYYWSKSALFGAIRTSMAVLIVVFPVFMWVSWFLKKDVQTHPEKRNLTIRRWLLYMTLFFAALVIIGDLVALLMSFLNGELTMRFVWKVLIVLGIASSIFTHYFSELREKPFGWMRMFVWVVIAAVAVSIVAGFWVAGSPAQQRAIRFDEMRISHLSSMQYQVIDYWQRKNVLPVNLNELTNDVNGFEPYQDPQTGSDYGYRVTGPRSFELCATFETSNQADGRTGDPSVAVHVGGDTSTWDHGVGMTCFERTIDPDYYPPLKPVR